MSNHKSCKITQRKQKIGLKNFLIYEIQPNTYDSCGDISSFISLLSSFTQDGAITIISGLFQNYHFLNRDPELPGFKSVMSSTDSSKLHIIANSITNCIVMEIDNEDLKKVFKFEHGVGYIIASKSACRYICSVLGLELSAIKHAISLDFDISLDVDAFKHLWINPLSQKELMRESAKNLERSCFMMGVGKALGMLHSTDVLHGDTHLGNFIMTGYMSTNVKTPDFDFARMLLRDLKSEECAYDLLPLLAEVSKSDWAFFKTGYLRWFGERGAFVINLIEKGNELRWSVYIQKGDYDRALNLLFEELEKYKEKKNEITGLLYSNIGYCYSKSGRCDKAIEFYNIAKIIYKSKGHESDVTFTEHNIGMAYYRKKDFINAIKSFENVRSRNDAYPLENIDWYCGTLFKLTECYEQTGEFKSALQRIDELINLAQNSKFFNIKTLEEKRKEISEKISKINWK